MTAWDEGYPEPEWRPEYERRQALVWLAETERSRLHRLEVDARRDRAQYAAELTAQSARLYRCTGCGDWRYRAWNRMTRCPVCRELARESSLGVAA